MRLILLARNQREDSCRIVTNWLSDYLLDKVLLQSQQQLHFVLYNTAA